MILQLFPMRNTTLIIRLCLAAVLFFLPGFAAAAELTTEEVIANAREYLEGEKKSAVDEEKLTTEEVIAKAREYLGGDEKLESISTIQYNGVFESPVSGDSGYISILLKKTPHAAHGGPQRNYHRNNRHQRF